MRRVAAAALALVLGAWLLPKIHAVPPTLTNGVWAGGLEYQYRVIVGAGADDAEGTLHCDFFFDSYPYWEGDPGADLEGSVRQGIEQWCEKIPARLTSGIPPQHVFVVLRPNRRGYLYALNVGYASESEARHQLRPGDAIVEFTGPFLLGRLI